MSPDHATQSPLARLRAQLSSTDENVRATAMAALADSLIQLGIDWDELFAAHERRGGKPQTLPDTDWQEVEAWGDLSSYWRRYGGRLLTVRWHHCAVPGHPGGWLVTVDGTPVLGPCGELLVADRGFAQDLAEQRVDMELADMELAENE
jgi:hypothetical protein